MEKSIIKKNEKCIIHDVGNCTLCGESISRLKAEDFKITIDDKLVKVTKATYSPFNGGYIIEWDE